LMYARLNEQGGFPKKQVKYIGLGQIKGSSGMANKH